MTLFSRSLLLFSLLLLTAPLAGCKQGINDRCQIEDDCGTNTDGTQLTCVIPTGGSKSEGGTCQPASGAAVSGDMAVPASTDMAVPASTDMAVPASGDMAVPAATDMATTPADMISVPDLTPPDGLVNFG